jgi:hypothetical protein
MCLRGEDFRKEKKERKRGEKRKMEEKRVKLDPIAEAILAEWERAGGLYKLAATIVRAEEEEKEKR